MLCWILSLEYQYRTICLLVEILETLKKISGDEAIETEEELHLCDSFEDLEEFEGILSNNSRRKKIVSLIVPRIP